MSWTQKMEREAEGRIIRFPRSINLHEDKCPELTDHQVHMMRALLRNNNVDLDQFPMKPDAADDEKRSMALSLARAYNATIAEQKRKIINSYKRAPKFTFGWIGDWCHSLCEMRGFSWVPGKRFDIIIGCTTHDIVKYPFEDFYLSPTTPLKEARDTLLYSHIGYMPEYQMEMLPGLMSTLRECMQSIEDTLDVYTIPVFDIRTASDIFEEKFLALDAQYKVIHCLLSENNPITRAIRAKREHWGHFEDRFMKILARFEEEEIYRLAADDDGVWCDMFDFVCEWANKEGILPKLNDARKLIAETFLARQESLSKWVKRMKGTS